MKASLLIFTGILSLSCFISYASAERLSVIHPAPATDTCPEQQTESDYFIADSRQDTQITQDNSKDTAACLTCRYTPMFGGYLEGQHGATFYGQWFQCDNADEKAAAIREVLDHYQAKDSSGNTGDCWGWCISGSCMANGLKSSNIDGCNLRLNRDGNDCRYSMKCREPHSPKFTLECGCV